MKSKLLKPSSSPFPPSAPPELPTFATGEVAHILDLPIWRVQKFLDSPKYHLSPQWKIGTGLGSRRVFTREGICRIAIAWQMIQDGFMARVVGSVAEQIEDSDFRPSSVEEGREQPPPSIMGVVRSPKGPLVRFYDEKLRPRISGEEPYYLLNLDAVIGRIDKQIAELKK